MRVLRTLVGQLTADNIETLIREHVPESRRLDYKRDVPTEDKQKADLVNDVCSFANTDGGVIIFGIDERDAAGNKTGKAQRIAGIDGTADDAIVRLTQAVESKITPSIGRLLRFQALETEGAHTVLALGIAQSYARPHREENKQRYWLRNDGGKYQPDVVETRRMFLESESWIDQAEAFVSSRVRALGRIPFNESAFAAVHVLPLGRLRQQLDLAPIYDRVNSLPPSDGGAMQVRPNLDGACGQTAVYNTPALLSEHVQVFRFGGMEFASTRAVRSHDVHGQHIYGDLLTRNVRSVIHNAVRELGIAFGLDAPFLLSLALRGAEGYTFRRGSNLFIPLPVTDDELRIPSVIFEPAGDLDVSIRQLTDVLWQAVGTRDAYWPDDAI